MTIDELHTTVVEGFRRVENRLAGHDQRLVGIDERFETIAARIREESETMRRHFDVMVEKVEAAVKIVAEGHGHLQTVVDNHEARLQGLEKRAAR